MRIFILALLLSGCSKEIFNFGKTEKDIEAFVHPKLGVLETSIKGEGIVKSLNRKTFYAKNFSRVLEVDVEKDEEVLKGQYLLTYRDETQASRVAGAKRSLEMAKIDRANQKLEMKEVTNHYRRKRILYKKNIITKAEYENVEKRYLQMKNSFTKAELEFGEQEKKLKRLVGDVEGRKIFSPFNGAIESILKWDEGKSYAFVAAKSKFVSIYDPALLRFEIHVSESDFYKISVGEKMHVNFGSLNLDIVIDINILEVVPGGKSRPPRYIVGAKIDSPPKGLVRGLDGTAKIVFKKKDNILIVPKAFINDLGGKPYVLVKAESGGAVKSIPVKIGLQTKKEVEVVEGVTIKDKIYLKFNKKENS